MVHKAAFHQGINYMLSSMTELHHLLDSFIDNPLKYKTDYSIIDVLIDMG